MLGQWSHIFFNKPYLQFKNIGTSAFCLGYVGSLLADETEDRRGVSEGVSLPMEGSIWGGGVRQRESSCSHNRKYSSGLSSVE
jgi:hypothetical protein